MRFQKRVFLAGVALAFAAFEPNAVVFMSSGSEALAQPPQNPPTSGVASVPSDSDPPVPTLHVTSRLVVLDVVVTDANGNPAHGLKQSDFTLTEDGVPQSLASFTEHGAPELAGPTSPLPPNTFAVQPPPAEDQTKTVIVLADPTSWPPSGDVPEFPGGCPIITHGREPGGNCNTNTGYARNDIAAFLKTAPSTQPIAIVRLDWQGMHLVQGLTTDRDRLTEAIASKRMEPPLGFVVRFTHAAGSPSQQLVRYVNAIPGRINLVWISYSGDLPDLSGVARGLNGSSSIMDLGRVALYPIPLNQESLGDNEAQIEAAEAAGGHAYFTGISQALTEIAATGSAYYTISYVPTNPNWNGAFRKIKVSVAGFPQAPPSETWSSAWSQFLGWTESQKSKILYRPGYRARATPTPAEESVRLLQGLSQPPDSEPNRKLISSSPKGNPARYGAAAAATLQRAMQFGSLPPDGVNFTLSASPSADASELKPGAQLPEMNFLTQPFRQNSLQSVRLHYRIDPRSLTFSRDASGSYRDDLEFVAVVYRDDGTPANSITSTEQVEVSGDGIEGPLTAATTSGITFDQTIAVPISGNPVPGNFFLRVAIDERSTNHVGAIEIPAEWIKLPPAQMTKPK
jgi:VWFA-related protein